MSPLPHAVSPLNELQLKESDFIRRWSKRRKRWDKNGSGRCNIGNGGSSGIGYEIYLSSNALGLEQSTNDDGG